MDCDKDDEDPGVQVVDMETAARRRAFRRMVNGLPADVTIVEIRGKYIMDDWFVQDLLPKLRICAKLESLVLMYNGLGKASIHSLALMLSLGLHKSLKELALFECHLASESREELLLLTSTLPQACPYLERLGLGHQSITCDVGTQILQTLKTMASIKKVALIGELIITDADESFLRNVLVNWPTLEELGFFPHSITLDGVSHLLRIIGHTRLGVLTLRLDHFSASIESRIREDLQKILGLIADEFALMVCIVSAKQVRRIGVRSSFRLLPMDLMRKLAMMLYATPDLNFSGMTVK